MTVTFEFFSPDIDERSSPFPFEEYSKNCIPFWIARFPAIFDIGIRSGYSFPLIIISVAIPVNFFSNSIFVSERFDAR